MDWYYAEAGQQRGPLSEPDFEGLVRVGTIRDGTLVWREGMASWQPYGRIKGGVSQSAAPGPVPDNAVVCSGCGRIFGRDEVIRFGESWVCAACKPAFVQRLKEGTFVAGAMEYAGFWIRLVAKIVDNLIVLLVIGVPILILILIFSASSLGISLHPAGTRDPGVLVGAPWSGAEGMIANVAVLLAQLFFFVVNVGYSTFFVGKYGATPGKMACKLKVVDAEGSKIGYPRAFGRACAEILSRLICSIGYIIAAFDSQKRALHDHICSTRVVHNR